MQVCITDQPGRLFAVFVLSPILLLCGMRLLQARNVDEIGRFLIIFSIFFFSYEAFWLVFKVPKQAELYI
mgnify:CR=1 FL=1